MPSAWRKAKLGEIPRLLASAVGSRARRGVGDSALVVQAGFPTSVADLVVKNRGRLKKKAPRWLRRQRHHGEAEAGVEAAAGCSTSSSLVSEIVAAEASGDARAPSESALRPAETGRKDEEAQRMPVVAAVETRWDEICREGLESSRWEEAEEEVREAEGSASEASTRPESEKDALQTRNRWRFVMPSKVVFLAFVLAIGTQKIALGASISAFFILLLESLGRRRIPSPKPFEGSKKKNSNTIAGVVSDPRSNARIPIKSLAAFCERSLEYKVPLEAPPPVLALEPKDHVKAEGSRKDQKACNTSKKAKKLLKKFVPKKLRGSKGEKGARAEPASDCSSRGASHHTGEVEEPLEEEEDGCPGGDAYKDEEEEQRGGTLGFVVAAGIQDVGFKGAAFLGENAGGKARGSSGHLLLFLIILSGLVGGRVAAMVLTILWCLLVSSAGSLCKCWKMQQSH